MDDQSHTFWWKFWGRPVHFFLWVTAFSVFGWVASGFYFEHVHRGPNWNDARAEVIIGGFFLATVLSLFGLILSAIPQTRPAMNWILRRWFFCAAALVTLIALFYAEENWRGKRAWEQCKRDMDAKGFEMDWNKHIPEPVPDAQNIFKAPKMQEWFVGRLSPTNGIADRLASRQTDSISGKTNAIVTEAQARDYLAWSDQFVPEFNLIREALKRPYARMDGDYSLPADVPVPNFVAARQLARTLAQRAHSYFILQQPDKASEEVTLLHDMCRMFQGAPTGEPMTLVAAMINVAVTGLYADTIGEGFKLRAWREPQLVALQEQLKETHLLPFVMQAFHDEPAASSYMFETAPHKVVDFLNSSAGMKLYSIAPRGWDYQNLVNIARFSPLATGSFDADRDSILPAVCNENQKQLETSLSQRSPFRIFAAIAIPNFNKAIMVTARNQNLINQGLVASALERYHLVHGEYPESLDALTPQFIEKLSHDVINGGKLKYHKTDNSFVLYSIGWNEKDDGGTTALNKDGSTDWKNGDWVWPYAPK